VEGDTVTLSCDVHSDPYYTLTRHWYHNSSLLSSTHALINEDGSLILQSVSKVDAGSYTCTVDSDGGNDSSLGWIHIIGKCGRQLSSTCWLLNLIDFVVCSHHHYHHKLGE